MNPRSILSLRVLCLAGVSALTCLLTAAPAGAQCMQQKLLAPDASPVDQFGETVALIPGWAFIGSPLDDDVQSQSGAVYVYQQGSTDWIFAQKLKAIDPTFGGALGTALATSGDWMVATTPFDDPQGAFGAGSAHVYNLQGGNWVHTQKVLASDFAGVFSEFFGMSAALRGDRMVIGEENDNTKSVHAGSAYVFELQGSTWVEVAKLYAQDWEVYGSFGSSVAVDGDTIVVGASEHDNGFGAGADRGAAYVFERIGGSWVQTQKLLPSDPGNQNHFGWSVALQGDSILVSGHAHVHSPGTMGAAYVFNQQGSTWIETQELLPVDPAPDLRFGAFVCIDGELAICSGHTDDDLGNISGSAYAFRRLGASWTQIGKLLAPDGAPGDLLSCSVSLSGSTVVLGALGGDDACVSNPACDSGSAYVFELGPDAEQYCFCGTTAPCGNTDDFGGCASSAGHGAVLSACGSGSVASDDLVLEARWLPPNLPAIFFMGGASTGLPFGDGRLCLSAGSAGVYRYLPPQSTGTGGVITLGPGLVAYTQSAFPAPGQLAAGQTWYFQAWFRDPAGPCGKSSNLSNGLKVVFKP